MHWRYPRDMRREFRAAVVAVLDVEYGPAGEKAASGRHSPDQPAVIGVCRAADLAPVPANARRAARLFADVIGADRSPPAPAHRAAEGV